MRLMIIFIICLFLPGCFGEDRIIYKEVKIMVPGKVVRPPDFRKPHLPISEIDKDTPDDIVGAAYYETVKILENEVDKRDKALDVYRNSDNEDKPK